MKSQPSSQAPKGPSSEQLQAYLENRLSPAERERVEAMLASSADDREALEGLRALGPEDAAALSRQLNLDIDVLTASERPRRGAIRRMGYVRLSAAAAVLILLGSSFWFIAQWQQPQSEKQAFDRHFEPLKPEQDLASAGGSLESAAMDPSAASESDQGGQQQPFDAELIPPPPAEIMDIVEDEIEQDYFFGMDDPEEDLEWPREDQTWFSNEGQSWPSVSSAAEEKRSATQAPSAFRETGPARAAAPVIERSDMDALDSGQEEYNMADQRLSDQKSAPGSEEGARKPISVTESLTRERARAEKSEIGNALNLRGSRNMQDDAPMGAQLIEQMDEEPPQLSETELVFQKTEPGAAGRGYKPAPDPFEQGLKAYVAGDFKVATEWFGLLGPGHAKADEAHLLEANAWLQRGKPERAEPLLSALVNAGDGPLLNQSRWYLALAHIALGKPAEARPHLLELEAGGGMLSGKASELLEEIGR